jgi:hypothetical protein
VAVKIFLLLSKKVPGNFVCKTTAFLQQCITYVRKVNGLCTGKVSNDDKYGGKSSRGKHGNALNRRAPHCPTSRLTSGWREGYCTVKDIFKYPAIREQRKALAVITLYPNLPLENYKFVKKI